MRKVLIALAVIVSFALCSCNRVKETPADVEKIIRLVNDYWQANNSPEVRPFWDHAAYNTGNMAAYKVTGDEKYRKYSEDWAEFNEWKGATSDNKEEWRYRYGERREYVLFGDWQCCFQTFCDLYNLDPDPRKIARAREVMEYEMSTPNNDYWWWADGLYMVMPVMTRLYKITGNKQYLDKLFEYFSYTDEVMFDPEVGLYYRDGSYVYPRHKTPDGKKDFWARGDGWVLAAFARVLTDLPEDNEHRDLYIDRFLRMASALKENQHEDGYWTRSITEHDYVPGPETSGTAFFCFGLQWGINNGFLKAKEYQPVVDKAWTYLTTVAMQPNGYVGYVQPIGAKAIPGQVVDANSTADFGVGAFLLAACERYYYLTAKQK